MSGNKEPKLYNKNRDKDIPKDAVYIGRGSPYGNPFKIGEHGTRDEVIAMFKQKLLENPAAMAQVRHELKDKDLVCFCTPAACHGEILMQVANAEELREIPSKERVKPLNAKTLAALPSMLVVTKDNIDYIDSALQSQGNPAKLVERYKQKREELQRSYEWLDSVIKAHV